jgi:phosphatidate cytidylyltransferase
VDRARPRALRQAIATGVLLVVVVAVAFALGRRAFFALVCAVAVLALLELVGALKRGGRRPVATLALAGGLALLGAAYAGRLAWMLVALAATALATLLAALRPGRGSTPATDAALTLLAVVWIAGGAAAALLLLRVDPGGMGLLVGFLGVVAAADIVAFFVGTLWGRRPMAPAISPAKTWEGFAGGVVAALVAGAVAGGVITELSVLEGVGLGVVCGLFGPVGDLVESLAKREIGVKDSGQLLPGHGGLLDRVDAMLFCAPIALAYVASLSG